MNEIFSKAYLFNSIPDGTEQVSQGMLLSIRNLSAIFQYRQCMPDLFLGGYWVSVKLALVEVIVKVEDLNIHVSRVSETLECHDIMLHTQFSQSTMVLSASASA
jgi:hypothetical protein